MKAFVVTVIVPSKWGTDDVVSAVHMGIKTRAVECDRLKDLSAMDYSAIAHSSFELRRQDDAEATHQ